MKAAKSSFESRVFLAAGRTSSEAEDQKKLLLIMFFLVDGIVFQEILNQSKVTF
jgi:hypothetical protein